MIVYSLMPIDFWSGWQKPEAIFRGIYEEDDSPHLDDVGAHLASEWAPLWRQARELARRLGWQGDVRDGPYVTVLPMTDNLPAEVVIAWKQSHAGWTFIAAPRRLPWLEDSKYCRPLWTDGIKEVDCG